MTGTGKIASLRHLTVAFREMPLVPSYGALASPLSYGEMSLGWNCVIPPMTVGLAELTFSQIFPRDRGEVVHDCLTLVIWNPPPSFAVDCAGIRVTHCALSCSRSISPKRAKMKGRNMISHRHATCHACWEAFKTAKVALF